MKRIKNAIDGYQLMFSDHIFFQNLEKARSHRRALVFTKSLAYWVMTFQDVLRLNDEKVRDPQLKKITRHHRLEDAGHDKWYLEDIKYLFPEQNLDIKMLFGRGEYERTRDASHALVSEVFRIKDDRIRVALLLVLESAGHVFFEKVANYVEAADLSHHLKYFSKTHLDVEKDHAIFEKELERIILSLELPPTLYAETLAMVERAYRAFDSMFDGLAELLELSEPAAEPELAELEESVS